MWSHQTPHAHTHVHMNYPHAGLGGHNFCRNPDASADGPWCFTLDYPNVRREACDVGPRASECDPTGTSHAMPGGAAAPTATKASTVATPLEFGKFADGEAAELELVHYSCAVPPSVPGLKIVLIPLTGDSDLFVSFGQPEPTRAQATWVEESVGPKQLVLPRSNPHFCAHVYIMAQGR